MVVTPLGERERSVKRRDILTDTCRLPSAPQGSLPFSPRRPFPSPRLPFPLRACLLVEYENRRLPWTKTFSERAYSWRVVGWCCWRVRVHLDGWPPPQPTILLSDFSGFHWSTQFGFRGPADLWRSRQQITLRFIIQGVPNSGDSRLMGRQNSSRRLTPQNAV